MTLEPGVDIDCDSIANRSLAFSHQSLVGKQWLRIAVVLGMLLLVVYLMTSMRSGAKLTEDKLVASKVQGVESDRDRLKVCAATVLVVSLCVSSSVSTVFI